MASVPQPRRGYSPDARASMTGARCLLHRLPRCAAWIPLLLLVAGPAPGWAAPETRVLFGPEEFVRTAAPRDRFERTVTIPPSARPPFTLHLINGTPDDDEKEEKKRGSNREEDRDKDEHKDQDDDRDVPSCGPSGEPRLRKGAVSSGRVRLDGVEVVSSREFAKPAEVIHKPLRLVPGLHRLEILISGAPGSHVCVTITGTLRLGKLAQARAGHTATLLPDGTVLMTGGRGADREVLASAEVFDPTSLQSALLSVELTTPRTEHTATLLPNGEVLHAAGRDRHGPLFSAELFQRDGTFTKLEASVQIPRAGHTATLLPNGRVLILGGVDVSRLDLAEGERFEVRDGLLYDPQSGRFTPLSGLLKVPRHHHTATLLPNGMVLVVGGRQEDANLGSAELVDPTTEESTLLDTPLRAARAQHTASLLNDGRVLIAGGRGKKDALDSVEVFDPATQTFSELRPKLKEERLNHTATVLPTGEILLAGGREEDEKDPTKDTELYLQPGRDTTPPTVLNITPASGATEVSLTPLIAIQFSEPIKVTTLTNETLMLVGSTASVSGIVSPGEEGLLAFFIPAAPLAPGITYTLHLQGLTDRAGNPLAPVTTLFTTAPVPAAGLSVDSFSPMSGPVGTAVTITGQNFEAVAANNQVTFNDTAAIITSASTTTITTTVPQGATTGRITVTTPQDTATSGQAFTVELSQNFTMSAAPAQTTVVQGGQGSYVLNVTAVGNYTGLVTLGVTGLPTGITATFSSPTLTAGQTAYLSLNAASGVPAGAVAFTLTGTAQLETGPSTQSIPLTLNVLASGGQTAVSGQFIRADNGTPIPNVQVTLAGIQVQSDAAGQFLIQNVPAGTQQLMIDSNVAVAGFPIYAVDLPLTAGQTTVLPPFRIMPPPPAERFVTINNTTADQIITDPRYPGLEVKLPAGVTITGWDGVPKTKIALERLDPVRTGIPPPPGPARSLYQIHFGTPTGGMTTAPIPVTFPNDLDLDPGARAEFWYYDASPFGGPAGWRFAGMATVTDDGTKIIPDPGVGIARFCGHCGIGCVLAQTEVLPKSGKKKRGDPVDLYSGQMIVEKTDLILPGRFPIALGRVYSSVDPIGGLGLFSGGLGLNWFFSTDVLLLPQNNNPNFIRMILPGNTRLDLAKQPDGTFTNRTDPFLKGAVLRSLSNGDRELRFKDGSTWKFRQLFTFQGGGNVEFLIEQADRHGNRITIERLAGGISGGQPTRILDAAGRALTFSSSGERITQVQDPLGRTVMYAYDAAGRLATVTDPAGGVTHYTYDTVGRMLTITDARGIQFIQNFYGPSGRVLRQVQADGGEWRFHYQLSGATVSGPGCPGLSCPSIDSWENLQAGYTIFRGSVSATTVVDPKGAAMTTRFNGTGFDSEEVDALGQRTASTRDGENQLTATTDGLGRQTRFTFDAAGNVTAITDAAGQQTRFAYEPTFSRLTQLTDAIDQVTSFAYDTSGNLLSTADPLGHTTSVMYNSFGQPTSVTDSLGHTTTFDYNAEGNLIATTDPMGNTTRREYDAVGRLVRLIDPRGAVTDFAYDPLNRVAAITDAAGGVTTFTYDLNGNLLTVTDAEGHTTTYTYDLMDRLLTRTDALGRSERYEYDPAGNLTRFTDRKNQVATFQYDALSRRIRADYADGSFTTFTYDAAGRLIAAVDSVVGRIDFVYDLLDRLIKEISAQGVVEYTYDALGRRTTMTANGGPPLSYGYDAASRLIQVAHAGLVVGLSYDAAGQRTSLTYPNGTNTSYTYDNVSRLTAITHNGPSGLIESLSYTYDAAGNRISLTRTNGTATLLPAAVQAAYDAANEQVQFNAASPNQTFDANGNLTTQTDASGTTTYQWDARNRLVGISGPGLSASFSYDALGRRVSKTINGVMTEFLYDGNDIVQEIGGGAVGASYVRSLNIDEPFIRQTAAGNELYHTDALGSTVALTNPAASITASYAYEAFGKTTVTGTSSNPYQYTGRENDHAKIYYYRARYYDPNLSRFLSEDPIGLLGGVNVYVYARNSVIRFRDPLGLVTGTELAGEVGIGIIGGVVIGAGLIIESPALIVAGVVIVVVDGVVVGVKAVKEVREAVKERERRLEEIDRDSIQPRAQGTSDTLAPSGVGQSISDGGPSAEKGMGGRILGGRK